MTGFKVLVPLDGSQTAEAALDYLQPLSKLGDEDQVRVGQPPLSVKLISVVDDGAAFGLADAVIWQEKEERLLTSYLEAKRDLLQHQIGSVEIVVRHGPPASVILDEVSSYAPDLLLLSTHGRSGVERWRLGSVADKLIRQATRDTLVVGPKAARPGVTSIRSILVPLDGSELAEEALPKAQRLAEAFGAEVYLMRVIPPQVIGEDVYGFSVAPETYDLLVEGADAYLNSLKDRGTANLKVVKPIIAPVADEILAFVNSHSVDLIVMTSHGRGGVLRAALGSITDRAIGGPAPVLVVRPASASG